MAKISHSSTNAQTLSGREDFFPKLSETRTLQFLIHITKYEYYTCTIQVANDIDVDATLNLPRKRKRKRM